MSKSGQKIIPLSRLPDFNKQNAELAIAIKLLPQLYPVYEQNKAGQYTNR